MPNYNQTLQTNNSSLEEIITQLNNMPDAGENSNPVLQDKTVTPTTSVQTVTADNGYDGLDTVTVNAMPTATQATPTISVSSSGLITASATQTAGYVSAGTKSATKQLTTQGAKTVTPSIYSQTVVAKNVYTTGAVTVAAIPSNYEDVTTETSAYTTKIASLETAIAALESELEGKAGGSSSGGNLNTCTITISSQMGNIYDYAYTAVIDGTVTAVYAEPQASTKTLTNVLCGSLITVRNSNISIIGAASVSGEGAFLSWNPYNFYFSAPTTAGAETTFTIWDDD